MEKFRTSDSWYESSNLSKRTDWSIKAYNSMVEYTSDICGVDSSNLFKPKFVASVAKFGRRAKLRI